MDCRTSVRLVSGVLEVGGHPLLLFYLKAGGLSVSLVPGVLEVGGHPLLLRVHLVAGQALQLPNGLLTTNSVIKQIVSFF